MKTPAYLAPNSSAPCVVELPVGGAAWHQLSEAEWSQSTDLRRILHTLDFCNLVVKIAHPNIRDQLLYFISSAFLVPVLGSALHQSALNEVVAATAYLELFLRRLTEPLLIKLFLRFIMTGSHDSSLIITSLINRLNANATVVTDVMYQLGMVTLSLFRTILSFHCEDVMYDLIFRHLEHLHHLECTRLPTSSVDRHLRPGRTRWPTPAPRKPSTPSAHPPLSNLAVDLVRSGDRFLGLASASAPDTEPCHTVSKECSHCIRTAEDKSSSNSVMINNKFVAMAQRPSDETTASSSFICSQADHCSCKSSHILPESPNIFLYLKSAERRIQRRRSACRFWSSEYFPLTSSCDPPFLFGRTDEGPLSCGEEIYGMLLDVAKHAAEFSSPTPKLEATDVYQPAPLSLSSRTQSSSLYQLNFIQDLSDEESECSDAVASSVAIPIASPTTSLSRPTGSPDPRAATDSLSRQTPDSSSYSGEKCTCTLQVSKFNSSFNASSVTVIPQCETDEFRAFLTLLDGVQSPWKCSKHYDYLPSSTTWPPFGEVFFEELDSLYARLFSAPVSKATPLVDKSQRTDCVQPSTPVWTPQPPLSTSHSHPIHRGSIKRTNPYLPIAGGIGPFLSIILNRLSTLHTNCLFTNLLLTDLIASLAAYSCPLLYTFLLNSVGLCLRSNVNSLFKVLRQVKSQLTASAASVESWHSLVYRARLYLHSGLLYSTDTVVDPRFYTMDGQEASLSPSLLACSSPRNSSRGSPSGYQSIMRPLHEVRTVWLPLTGESIQQGDADGLQNRTSTSPSSSESRKPCTRSSIGDSPAIPLFPVQLSMRRDSSQSTRRSSLTPSSSLLPTPFWNISVNLKRTPPASKQTSPLRSQSSRPLSAVRKRFFRHADQLVHRSTSSDRDDRDPAQSDLNTRTRNLVFGAIIFDEFCTELAALSYLHSMHAEVFSAFPSSTESYGSKG
ncbi:unnamed protein product [Dicrocoelium dendriticum]|nr:unnamed protein product [Dicrocoelium dendriticum]